MNIYYEEIIGDVRNYYEVDHNRRHIFWKEHPTAKEISKKRYAELFVPAIESEMRKASEIKEDPKPFEEPIVKKTGFFKNLFKKK